MKNAIIITFNILAATSGICLLLEDTFKSKLPISRINVFKLMVLSIFDWICNQKLSQPHHTKEYASQHFLKTIS